MPPISPVRWLLIGFFLFIAWTAAGAAEDLGRMARGKVTLVVELERGADAQATLIGRFMPDAQPAGLHLYSIDTPEDAVGAGYPTRLEIAPGGLLRTSGPLTADRQAHPHPMGGVVYPAGPVTVRLPVDLPTTADGAPVEVTLQGDCITLRVTRRRVSGVR